LLLQAKYFWQSFNCRVNDVHSALSSIDYSFCLGKDFFIYNFFYKFSAQSPGGFINSLPRKTVSQFLMFIFARLANA